MATGRPRDGRLAEGRAEHVLELLASASVAVWECDLTTASVAWTGDMEAMFGRPEHEFNGTLERFLEFIHPEDHAAMTQAVAVAVGRGGLYEAEFRALWPDGSVRWLSERGRVLVDVNSQPARIIGVVQDITERKIYEENLVVQALHDPLTCLPNRILFRERVEQLTRQRSDGSVSAVFVMDLDGFKQVNDRYGHAIGDATLCQIAARWSAVLRRGETLARLAGDEFGVLTTNLDAPATAVLIAQRLRKQLREPVKVGIDPFSIGVSIGIAVFPQHGEDFDVLLKHADEAMYQAKASGQGCVLFSSSASVS